MAAVHDGEEDRTGAGRSALGHQPDPDPRPGLRQGLAARLRPGLADHGQAVGAVVRHPGELAGALRTAVDHDHGAVVRHGRGGRAPDRRQQRQVGGRDLAVPDRLGGPGLRRRLGRRRRRRGERGRRRSGDGGRRRLRRRRRGRRIRGRGRRGLRPR
ncbi:hypothetical protein EF904_12475 [Streptomyces sp. WAC05950]|nr:hypothetical protein EF904_12475 [Streptomyces sp. WAC05950]